MLEIVLVRYSVYLQISVHCRYHYFYNVNEKGELI